MNSVCVKTFLWLTCLSVGVQLIQAKPQKYCKDPGVPRFVRRFKPLSSQGFKPGTILNYYCPPKFIFKGSKDLKCNTNGKWNATLPACEEPKCAAAKLPAYTYVIRPKNWRGIRAYGSRLSLGCNPGYKTTQRGSLVCVTPAWNVVPSNFKCFPKSCTDPGRPRHGDRKGQFTFGQKVYFTCDKCYKLKGPRHRQCQANQKWSDTQPTCERAYCGRPQALLNGFLGLSTLECGRTAQYQCRYGYKLVGPSNRTCQSNETWSGAEPICVVETNIALNKPAKQSSNSWDWIGPAFRAVDGNRNPNYYRGSSCSKTQHERGPWWTVDLLKELLKSSFEGVTSN